MHPELFTIPGIGISIKTYGFFLMVGFLSAVWLAMRRAARVNADPDRVLDVSFFALLFGVGGARLFYVMHYWHTDFANRANIPFAVVDIRQGGLEFLGGLLGATLAILIYLWWKKAPVRLYLDILAPGAMWGLAIGRIGCFFNGCCFGGLAVMGDGQTARYPWAVRFPYGSPAHIKQWEERHVTVPAELINARSASAYLLPATTLETSVAAREGPQRKVEQLEKALVDAKAIDPAGERAGKITAQLEAAKASRDAARHELMLDDLEWAQKYPSRMNPERASSVSELQQLAAQCQSLPIHPAQLYSSVNGFILAGLLSAVFYIRKREGVVMALLLALYPVSRVLEEMIRVDNPHDAAGLTISQFISVLMFLAGLTYLVILYKFLPERAAQVNGE